MGAIAISEPISIKFDILIFRPNLAVCTKFHTIRSDITRLMHNKRQIGKRYICELYLNFDRLSPISIGVRPWAKQMLFGKFHLNRIINATCILFTKYMDGRTCINRFIMWFYSDHQKELWVYLVSFYLLQTNAQRHNTLTWRCRV